MVGRCYEIAVQLVVALFAFLGTDILGARNVWKDDHGIHGAAGNGRQGKDQCASGRRQPSLTSYAQLTKYAEVAIYHWARIFSKKSALPFGTATLNNRSPSLVCSFYLFNSASIQVCAVSKRVMA